MTRSSGINSRFCRDLGAHRYGHRYLAIAEILSVRYARFGESVRQKSSIIACLVFELLARVGRAPVLAKLCRQKHIDFRVAKGVLLILFECSLSLAVSLTIRVRSTFVYCC